MTAIPLLFSSVSQVVCSVLWHSYKIVPSESSCLVVLHGIFLSSSVQAGAATPRNSARSDILISDLQAHEVRNMRIEAPSFKRCMETIYGLLITENIFCQ